MKNIEEMVRAYSVKYFADKLNTIPVLTYTRRSKCYGFFRHRGTNISININMFNRTSDVELRETILHEMTHAFLFVTGRPYKHNPRFKQMMRTIITKEFGIVPTGNPRFSLHLDKQLAGIAKPTPTVQTITIYPRSVPALPAIGKYKVISNGIMGEFMKESIAWGKKMVTLKVEGMMFPFTTELSNVERIG
jgi:hypothetical protein